MTPAEALALSESLSLYRQAYLSDAHHARHDQPSCKAPAMSGEELQRERAEEKIPGTNK
jgi:uncharacterized short protein YbdD (DUF466 family)